MRKSKTVASTALPRQDMFLERRRSLSGRRRTDRLPLPDQDLDQRKLDIIAVSPFRLEEQTKKVYVNGKEKNLSPKLFDLLKIFLMNPGQVLSAEKLVTNLWPANGCCESEKIKQYIYLLRKAIEPDPARPLWIRNVRGFGYKLMVDKS